MQDQRSRLIDLLTHATNNNLGVIAARADAMRPNLVRLDVEESVGALEAALIEFLADLVPVAVAALQSPTYGQDFLNMAPADADRFTRPLFEATDTEDQFLARRAIASSLPS